MLEDLPPSFVEKLLAPLTQESTINTRSQAPSKEPSLNTSADDSFSASNTSLNTSAACTQALISRRPGDEEKDEGTERETGATAVLLPTAPSVPSALRPVPGHHQRFQASNSSEEVVNASALGHRFPPRQCTVAYI